MLVTGKADVLKHNHQQQSNDDEQKSCSKNSAKTVKEKVVTPLQMLQLSDNLMSLKRKRKRNIYKYYKVIAVMLVKKINQ